MAAAAGIAATLLAALVVIGRDQGYPAAKVRLQAGLVWLASNQVGQLTLVDGSTAAVAAGISVSPPGHPLRVTQRGSDGYAVDQTDGSIARVDAATLHVVRHAALRSGGAVELLPGRAGVFLLDAAGLLATAAPDTLQLPRPPLAVPAIGVSGELRDSVVDGQGDLWAFYPRRGDLMWSDGRSVAVRHQVASPMAHLAVADDHPVLIDPGTGRTILLTPALADWKQQTFSNNLRSAASMTVTGSAKESRLYLVNPILGTLSSCYLRDGTCRTLIELGPGSQLGAAVESPDRVMLPDYASGRVYILDPTGSIVAQPQIMHPGRSFELLVHDGIAFYNDPNSDQAGVIEQDGRIRPLSKYRHNGDHQAGPTPHKTKPTTHTPTPTGGRQTRPGSAATSPTSDSTSPPGTTRAGGGTGRTSSPGGTGGNTAGAGGSTGGHGQRKGPPKIVRLIVTPSRPQVSQPVRFSAELTGQPPEHWHWTVVRLPGNNPEAASNQPTFQHVFTAHATYQVTLAVTRGPTEDRKSTTFTVTPPARRLSCGDVITEDTVLAADLTCASNGLTIAADNITLDLAGHTISGSGGNGLSVGITIAKRSAVTIADGRVDGHSTGILIDNSSNVRITQLVLASGVAMLSTTNQSVALDRITLSSYLHTFGAEGFILTDSQITGGDIQIIAQASGSHILQGNTIKDSQVLFAEMSNCQLLNNTMQNTSIDFHSGSDARISGNSITGGSLRFDNFSLATIADNIFLLAGVHVVHATEVSIRGNTITGSPSAGIDLQSDGGGTIHVSGNLLRNNGSAGLYLVGSASSPPPTGEITDNTFENNGHDSNGFTDPGGNAVNDGLHVHIDVPPGSSIVVARNHARDNADFGIEATPFSVSDGGGNTSIGDPNGCLGVVCT
jgi:hypothetical protein